MWGFCRRGGRNYGAFCPAVYKTYCKLLKWLCLLLIWDSVCESFRLVQRLCSRKWRQCWTCSCKLAASCLCSRRMAVAPRHHSCARRWWTGWTGFWTTSHSWSCWTLLMWHLWPTYQPCIAPWTACLEQFDVLEDPWCSRTRNALCRTRPHTVHHLSTWFVFVTLFFEGVCPKRPQLYPKTTHQHVENVLVLVCGAFRHFPFEVVSWLLICGKRSDIYCR